MGKVKRIYHIGDVHIRPFQRHVEYLRVFDRVFARIREIGTEDSLIVIAGDLLHLKTDTSSELVEIVTYFLRGCAKLCDVVIIPGNHDFNMTNKTRLDPISAIIYAMDIDNIHYIKYSGLHKYKNIDFIHYSLMDDDIADTSECTGEFPIIGLYHGIVSGASTDTGFSDFRHPISLDTFKGCDVVLLGDIHKTQYLNDEKTIAYCGSLIQQDRSEGLMRGMLVWDVESRTSEFIPIHNEYAFIDVEIDNGKFVENVDFSTFPVRSKIRILHKNTKEKTLQLLKNEIIRQLPEATITGLDEVIDDIKAEYNIDLDDVVNSRNEDSQMNLILEYLTKNGVELSDKIKNKLYEINGDLNTKIRDPQYTTSLVWKPVSFEFSNMFTYGENNVINFDKLKDSVGLFAPNRTGKSSLIDAILYCVFGKCSRASRAVKIINNKSDWFHSEFVFEIGNDTFTIIRRGERTKKSASSSVDFRVVNSDGEEKSLNGKTVNETNKIIRDYVGVYDDFVLTTVSTQIDNKSIIKLTKKERQELLYRFLDIFVYVELGELGKKKLNELKSYMNNFNSKEYYTELQELKEDLKVKKIVLANVNESIEEFEDIVNKYTEKIESKLSEKVVLGADWNIFRLENEKLQLEETIEVHKDSYGVRKMELDKLWDIVKVKINIVDTADIDELNRIRIGLIEELDSISVTKSRLLLLEKDKASFLGDIQRFKQHEYNPDCEYCVKNSNDLVHNFEVAHKELIIIDEQIDDCNGIILAEEGIQEHLKVINEKIKVYNQLKNETNSLKHKAEHEEKQLENLLTTIELKEEKLQLCKNNIELYYKREDIIKANHNIDIIVQELKNDRKINEEILNNNRTKKTSVLNEKSLIENRIQSIEEFIDEYENTLDEYNAYKHYVSAVNRDGVPFMILTKVIPIIEESVNSVLRDMVDFSFSLRIDDDNNIDGFIVYENGDEWDMELTSGMERFIISTAIRSSLVKLSTLPKPNFMIIDEGFGVLDSNSIDSVRSLFDYLKDQFDFVLFVTHIDKLKDYADFSIDINLEKERSKIVFM